MNIVSLCNESCLTSQPDKQVLWCGQDRHVGSNLVTIHHNRMLQTAEKRHNPCNSDHILGHVQFQNKSWIQNFKFSVYIHMPPLSSHNRIRNSNSFICIPRVPPSMCFWTWLFTASMCVCVCVCVWLVSILNTDGGPCSASQNHSYVKNSWCHPRQHSIIQWESLLTVLCVCDTLIKQ